MGIGLTYVLLGFSAILVICFIVIMHFTSRMYNRAFGSRVDTKNGFYSFVAKVRPGFVREPVQFPSNSGQKLQGYFYHCENIRCKGLIVLAHGMGGGHSNYLSEAEYFAKSGYLVFSYDNTGTNESRGSSLIGLPQSAIDLQAALAFLETLPELKIFPWLLYGHSWGGYAVAAATPCPSSVKGIVSVSGFERESNVLKGEGAHMVGNAIGFFMPFVHLHEWMIFGKNAGHSGIAGLENTDAKVLLIHSENDKIVSYEENFLKYRKAFGENPRFAFLSLPDSGHNVTHPPRLFEEIQRIQKERNALNPVDEEKRKLLTEQEWALTLQLDPEIMGKIVDFFDSVTAE